MKNAMMATQQTVTDAMHSVVSKLDSPAYTCQYHPIRAGCLQIPVLLCLVVVMAE